MAKQFTIDVGGASYSGTTASAQAQMEALHILMRTGLIASLREEHTDMGLVVALGALSWEDVKHLEALLMKDCVTRYSDDVPVAVNLFRDNVQDYYLLLMKVVQENLAGFWTLRPRTEGAAAAERTS